MLLPQVLVSAKSFASIPVMEMLVMFTAAPPLLVSVILFGRLLVPTGWLPKVTFVGTSCTKVPVPVSGTFCGLPGALSVTCAAQTAKRLIQ